MSKDEKQFEQEGPLMSNELFAEFMEAKFKKEKPAENDIDKTQAWNELAQKMSPPIPAKQHNWVTLASVAMLIIAILPTLFISTAPDISRIKGNAQFIDSVIEIYKLTADGALIEANNNIQVNETLVFKAHIPQEGVIALALQKNNEKAKIRFISGVISADRPLLLKRDKVTYGYSVEENDITLRFCLIAASTINDLEKKINRLAKIWMKLPQSACKTINTG